MFACGIKKKAILDAQRELGLVEYLDKETPERRPEISALTCDRSRVLRRWEQTRLPARPVCGLPECRHS